MVNIMRTFKDIALNEKDLLKEFKVLMDEYSDSVDGGLTSIELGSILTDVKVYGKSIANIFSDKMIKIALGKATFKKETDIINKTFDFARKNAEALDTQIKSMSSAELNAFKK
jgi:hypothetical protein